MGSLPDPALQAYSDSFLEKLAKGDDKKKARDAREVLSRRQKLRGADSHWLTKKRGK